MATSTRSVDGLTSKPLSIQSGITFLVIKGSKTYDMTQLVQSIRWSGAKSAMPRTLEVTMLDNDSYTRPDIKIESGYMCLFMWNGEELFRGIFFTASQSVSRTGTYKAYDAGIYLTKNMDTFVFKKKTATEIFNSICNSFGLDHTSVNTSYVINDLTMPNTTAADAIWKALAKTYKAKGTRFYVLSQKGVLKLISRADNMVQLVLEEGANVIDFSREVSIENTYTRVKLYSDANKVLASAKDSGIESNLGVMQYTEQGDSEKKKAALESKAKNLLSIKKQTEETLEVELIGDATVYSGVAVYVNLPYLGITQTYYVDEDEHEFVGNKHTMRLKLNATNDVEGADEDDDDD